MSATAPNPAELYEQFYGPGIFQPLARLFLDFVGLRQGERVLDLACGTGIVARRAAPLLGRSGRVVGVDVNPAMLAVARRLPVPGGAPIEWREGDAMELDLGDERFDVALCQQGLQFFPDPVPALRRVQAALLPGGRFAVAAWQEIERQTFLARFAEVEARYLEPLGVSYDDLVAPFTLGRPGRLQELLAGAGLAEVRVVPASVRTRFPDPESFVRKVERAYGAVVPAFVADPAAFEAFVGVVERETSELVREHTVDGFVSYEMHTWLASARATGGRPESIEVAVPA